MEFKVGDRVWAKGNIDGYEGEGTICEVDSNTFTSRSYGILFDGKAQVRIWGIDKTIKRLPTKHPTIIIQTDGTTTTATLRQGKNVLRTAEVKLHPKDTFDHATGAVLALNKLMPRPVEVVSAEVKPVEQSEPIKLYCFKDRKSDWTPLTKGKVYSFEYGGIMYDNGSATSARDKTLGGWIKRNPNITKHLIPLVSRSAKVGEWIYVTATDGHGKDKGVYQVTRLADYNDRWVFVDDQNCIRYDQYLVLDGYAPKPEVKEVKRAAKVGEWVKITEAHDDNQIVGGIYQIIENSPNDHKYAYIRTKTPTKEYCPIPGVSQPFSYTKSDFYVVLENYAPETE